MRPPAGLIAYRFATWLVAPAARIFLNQRITRGKEDKARIKERLGFGAMPRPEGKLVWVHGASVGECVSALPLIEKLVEDGIQVLVTSGTVTSAKVMAKQLPAAAIHQFVPIDTPRATARFLTHWKPDVGLFVDSDMWPNLLLSARARGVKLAMINARMSPKSFENWRHAPKTAKALLSCFDACMAQDDVIATRFRKLGAQNVQVAGNLKADAPALEADAVKLDALRAAIGDRPLLLAAQTHPGEDETILPAHDLLRQRFSDLLTILVPRHTERGCDIEMLCGTRACSRRATGALPAQTDEVYIADTMGELGLFYRLAPFTFVGGTLVPMGGHNPLEPAKLGCAVLAGPHIFNSATAFAAIFAAQGLGPVTASADIAAVTAQLLSSPEEAKTLGQAANASAASLGGAVAKTIALIQELLHGAPDFWQAQDPGSQLLATALSPLGFIYGASVAWKARHAAPYRARAKVICVGNLTVGGTGKTPVALAVAQMLPGRKVFFLSRGYGGAEKGPLGVTPSATAQSVGDEPLLLALAAPTIVAADRSAGAKLADEAGADIIIMDDGHQNFSLAKDLSIVVVDGESGFGNGRILPAGPLREQVRQGLGRADAVVIMGEKTVSLPDLSIPALSAHLETSALPELHGANVLAFAGIGRPEKFFNALPSLGMTVLKTKAFADHYFYTPSDIESLKTAARNLNARLVTTQKDYLRLAPREREGITAIPVQAVFSDPAALQRLLDRL